MVDFRFGPVELYLVSLDGDRPAPAVIAALTDLVAAGTVNLLDFVVVSKAEDGTVTAIEIEEHADEYGAADLEFAALGVTGQEDIDEFAELIEPGHLRRRRRTGTRLGGTSVLRGAGVERIPAPVVNALVDALDNEGE